MSGNTIGLKSLMNHLQKSPGNAGVVNGLEAGASPELLRPLGQFLSYLV